MEQWWLGLRTLQRRLGLRKTVVSARFIEQYGGGSIYETKVVTQFSNTPVVARFANLSMVAMAAYCPFEIVSDFKALSIY
jgi:hypothetical protein